MTRGRKPYTPEPGTVPAKVVAHRIEFWRKTVANQLMVQGERNHRALTALVLANRGWHAGVRDGGDTMFDPSGFDLQGLLSQA